MPTLVSFNILYKVYIKITVNTQVGNKYKSLLFYYSISLLSLFYQGYGNLTTGNCLSLPFLGLWRPQNAPHHVPRYLTVAHLCKTDTCRYPSQTHTTMHLWRSALHSALLGRQLESHSLNVPRETELQFPAVVTCSFMPVLLAFLPSLAHLSHSLTSASWDLFPNKLLAHEPLSQALLSGNLKWRFKSKFQAMRFHGRMGWKNWSASHLSPSASAKGTSRHAQSLGPLNSATCFCSNFYTILVCRGDCDNRVSL
jgi:hypothetical protein